MRATVFDIEATDLGASFGRLLCCSFVDIGSDQVDTFRRDKRPWKGSKLTDDSKLAIAIRDRVEATDILIGWNSILYDAPFVNARLAVAGERPIQIGERYGTHHLDLMYYSRGASMRIGSSRLESVAKFFAVENQKTPLVAETWADAAAGDPQAMAEVVEHCEQDVLTLRDLWPNLVPMVKKVQFNLSEVWPTLAAISSRRVRVP